MSRDKNFGSFGTGKPIFRKRRRGATVLFYLCVIAVVVLFGPPLWRKGAAVYRTVVEAESPEVVFGTLPPGLGSAEVTIEIKVSDAHSGLDEVIVQLEQPRSTKELLRKRYSRYQGADTISIPINAHALGVREGQVSLGVKVFDRSIWSNSVKKTAQFIVDYDAPRIEVISGQHNVYEGGVELVFYRLPSDPNAFSGVVVDANIYPGFPAITLDEAFASVPDVYFAFFAMPGGAKSKTPKVSIFARDGVGNTSHANFPFRVLGYEGRSGSVSLSIDEFSRMVDRVYQEYFEFSKKYLQEDIGEFYPTISAEELQERFSTVLEKFQPNVERAAGQLFANPKRERFWRGQFGRPGGLVDPRFGFLGKLDWTSNSEVLAETTQYELWFRAAKGRSVVAANTGKVIFADTFGTYGTTVILDHGFGLTTLYTHLSSVSCAEGDEVRKSDTVGLAGSSGLIDVSGSGFQIRLHGQAVRPAEWWDKRWLHEHLNIKIARVLKNLGVQTLRSIDSEDF